MKIVRNATETASTRFNRPVAFLCASCNTVKPCHRNGGTGYGITDAGLLHCYECCGKRDQDAMIRDGRATLYLSGGKVTNWPGTLSIPVRESRKGRHNIAGTRTDVWFRGPDFALWHGVQYGENTQLCHCRRVKGERA